MHRAFAKWSDEAMSMRGCDRAAQRFFVIVIDQRDNPPPRRDTILPPPHDEASFADSAPVGAQIGSFAEAEYVEADLTRDSRYEADEPSTITPLIAAFDHPHPAAQ